MSPKLLFHSLFLGFVLCLASCNGSSNDDDDTDTGDSRRTSDESFYKDRCDVDSDDDCFELRDDITVFNPDDFSDVTDFRVINIDEDDGQLKDGDVVIEMMLREGAPLPEPVEEGRILYRKKGNQITVRRIKAVQRDGDMARFLTENLALKDVFRRWRQRGRWAIDFDTGTTVKLAEGEEPGDRALSELSCDDSDPDKPAKKSMIDKINTKLPEGVTLDAGCSLTFDIVAEVQNIGGFVTAEGTSKIGVLGVAQFTADASLTTTKRITKAEGTAAEFIDFRPNDPANRIAIPLGPITLKLGAKFKVVAESSRANTVETSVSARIEAGPVVTKTAKKGYEFTFFDKRTPAEPTGGDGACDGEALLGYTEANPCFYYSPPLLTKDGEMSLKVGIEPEILITSPSIAGLAGITVGFYTFGEFEIEGEVDKTQVDSLTADGYVAGFNMDQAACWALNAGFTPTIGVEVLGAEIVEFNVATFKQEIVGECNEITYVIPGDEFDWCEQIDTFTLGGEVPANGVIDNILGPVFGDGLCMVDRHCTLLEQPSDKPQLQCIADNPTCDKESCTCEDPTVENGGLLIGPDLVGSQKIRDAWKDDPDSYCCLPQEIIKEEKEAGGPAKFWNQFSCNDNDWSTVDTCVEGRCFYEYLPGSCQTDGDCDPNDVWVAEDVSDDADRDLGEMSPGRLELSIGSCYTTFGPDQVDSDLIEKRWPESGGNFLLIDDNYGAEARNRFDADIASPLWDDEGKLGQKNELGICQWNGTPEGAVAAKPATEFLNCNVNNQDVDCDDGLPFTFDYCAPDPDVLKYDWASPEEAPRKWGRCYHGIRACPRYITPFLDQIDTKGLHECCEEVTGSKLKSNESWFVTTGDLPLSEPPPGYDWTCGRISKSINP